MVGWSRLNDPFQKKGGKGEIEGKGREVKSTSKRAKTTGQM